MLDVVRRRLLTLVYSFDEGRLTLHERLDQAGQSQTHLDVTKGLGLVELFKGNSAWTKSYRYGVNELLYCLITRLYVPDRRLRPSRRIESL